MNAEKRLKFVIHNMNTPFKGEILRDLEEALNDARADELENTCNLGKHIYVYNPDGSTMRSKELRIEQLRKRHD